jgi:hypothetical protein
MPSGFGSTTSMCETTPAGQYVVVACWFGEEAESIEHVASDHHEALVVASELVARIMSFCRGRYFARHIGVTPSGNLREGVVVQHLDDAGDLIVTWIWVERVEVCG